ncbi:MAG: DUF481 domain-containing protein [Ferruginibacter sp.]
MKNLVTLVFTLALSLSLHAQFNDSTFYMLRYATTGIINRTNDASSYTIANALKLSVSKKLIVLNSTSNWIYGKQQSRLINNDFTTALDFNRYLNENKKFYYWGLGTYESNYSLKVNYRTQMGIGVAYSPIDTTNFYINFSDGILYEFADLKLTDATSDVYRTFRNSFRFRLRYVYNERLIIDGVFFLQNGLKQASDYIINSTTTLSFKLMKWVSLTSSLNYNKVNRNNRENLLLTFGITAEKYF